MSKYDLFRDRTKIEKEISTGNVANFIDNSLSSTTINHLRLEEDIPAVLTRNHNEGNDEIILFTHYENDSEEYNLQVGDYIKHNTKHYMVYMEYDHPLRGKYLKYNLLECNIIIKFDNFSQYGSYFSSLRSFSGSSGKTYGELIVKVENGKPVVVTADSPSLKVNGRFLAANEGFRILSIDRISNQGIAYLSVEPAPYNAFTDNKIENKAVTTNAPTINIPENSLRKGEEKVILTNAGFVSFDPYVKIKKRTSTTVTFVVPFDINLLDITTKNTNGEFVLTSYEVV
jgi:hypothetical protein